MGTEASKRVKTESSSTKHVAKLSLDTLLPRNRRSYYKYEGSLTTPPCSETVSWFLFYDQPTVSEAQMQLFRLLETAEPSIISGELADNFRIFTGDTSTSSPTLAAMMMIVMRTLGGA